MPQAGRGLVILRMGHCKTDTCGNGQRAFHRINHKPLPRDHLAQRVGEMIGRAAIAHGCGDQEFFPAHAGDDAAIGKE